MREATLIEFLKDLNLWPLKYSGNSTFKTNCFYQQTRHEGGQDRRPSAIISFDNHDSPSWFTCFGCGTSKPFVEVVNETARYWNFRWSRLSVDYRIREEKELQERPLKRMGQKTYEVTNYTKKLKGLLKNDYPPAMIEFLASKGVSEAMAKEAFICFMPEGYVDDQMPVGDDGNPKPAFSDTIIIPTMIPHNGKLRCVGAQGRPWMTDIKYTTIYRYSSRYYFWGEQWLSEARGKPLFVTEGQFDAAHLRSLGFHAVAQMGVTLSHAKAIKLRVAGPSIVLPWLDPDTAGRTHNPRVAKELANEGLPYRIIANDIEPKYALEQEVKEILRLL